MSKAPPNSALRPSLLLAILTLGLLVACNRAPSTAPAGPPLSEQPVAGIAFISERDGNLEIYLLDLDTDALTNLTNHPADDNYPTWSPDDSRIAFTTNRDGNSEIYVMDRDGTNPRNLTNHPARDFWPAWSPVLAR